MEDLRRMRLVHPIEIMKARITILFGAFLLAATAHAKLNVVATTPDIAAIAKEIGGDKIELTTMARPTEDPHFVDAKPSFILKLNKADVLIHGGAELEVGWLPKLIEQARNAKIIGAAKGEVRCCEGVKMREVPEKLDRSAGDIHAAGNPHFLVDPENAKIVAHHIADAFVGLDAPNREFYEANAKRFIAALDAKPRCPLVLDADAITLLAPLTHGLEPHDVMTPHVGEFRRAFPGIWSSADDRIDAARAAAAYARCVVLLKGPDTVIAAPDGRAVVNTTGAPFLATAGSGDVLAGVIAGLIGQGMESFDAACAGAWLHGRTAETLGPGLIAEDLCENLPVVLNRLAPARLKRLDGDPI